jgi:hypothetical protein
MPLFQQRQEIERLRQAFEAEAAKFHDTRMTVFYIADEGAVPPLRFVTPNHGIMLWQYYGQMNAEKGPEVFLENLKDSDPKWGIRGARLTAFAVIEGAQYELFVRMAQRAGSLFDKDEAIANKTHTVDEIAEAERDAASASKAVLVSNDNTLAVWLNYLLYHLSMTHPGRETAWRIQPEPFTLSLLALERLEAELAIGKVDRSSRIFSAIKFKVGLSFPGEHRNYVKQVADTLRPTLGPDTVFYDHDYQAQLARPNLDTLLQDTYRNNCELVVVFLCEQYGQKQWCGLEWRAVRDIIKSKKDERVMFVRFDDANVDGVFSIDGYIDARSVSPEGVAAMILKRIAHT